MSLKNSHTTSSALQWDQALSLILMLERDNRPVWAVLIATGIYTGLRIGDILKLKWEQFEQPYIELQEGKTKKYRKITVADDLKAVLTRNQGTGQLVPYSQQHINLMLHKFNREYKLNIPHFSAHSLRKTFGRHVFEVNNESDKSLILLSELFNHASIKTTRIYLGLREQELQDIYSQL